MNDRWTDVGARKRWTPRLLTMLVAAGLTATSAGAGSTPFAAAAQYPQTTGATAKSTSDCPLDVFPAVTADPANRRYADPYLEVSCTDRHLVIESNGIPPYEFRPTTPNELRAQSYEWRLPLEAEEAAEITPVPLLGPIAVAINGLPIYGPNEGPRPDPFGDPVANEILDACAGHTAQRGDYHYHALLMACLAAEHPAGEPSPIVAYAFDGFPIHGPNGCADAACERVVAYRSGWVQTGDPRTHAWDKHEFVEDEEPLTLDRCNGHAGPDGSYHYHATATFPYILGCYRGYVDPSLTRPRRFDR